MRGVSLPAVSKAIEDILSELREKPQRRVIQISRADVNAESRELPLSFSSETPVERYWGIEVLDHSPGACDLSRLNAGGPLLLNHDNYDPDNQVGVVVSADVGVDRKGRAKVKFSRSARGTDILQDVQDGIRSSVSVGYEIHEMRLVKSENGVETYLVTRWTPYEISLVGTPADISVGVGRSQSTSQTPEMKSNQRILLDATATGGGGSTNTAATAAATTPAQTVNVEEVRATERQAERTRMKAFRELGSNTECMDLALRGIEEGWSMEKLQGEILKKRCNARELTTAESDPNTGASEQEVRSFSIVKAIRELALEGGLTGLEKELSEATAKRIKKTPQGFFIPNEVAMRGLDGVARNGKRNLTAGSNTAGGFTIGTNVMGGNLIELLRNKTVTDKLGVTRLDGLVGNAAIPRVSGGATVYWLPENGAVTASDQAFGQLVLTPHRAVANTAYSKELLMQSTIDVEGFVRDDLARVLAIAIDLAALAGTGNGGQPLGILNTSGLATSVTFGAAATWPKIISFETNVAASNADDGALAYVTSPGSRGKWKGIARFTNTGMPLWADDNTVNGYPAYATNQIPSDKVIFGNWRDLVIASWAGIDVVVDPYSLKKQGLIEVTVTIWTDIGVRHTVSFCISTDSGAQ